MHSAEKKLRGVLQRDLELILGRKGEKRRRERHHGHFKLASVKRNVGPKQHSVQGHEFHWGRYVRPRIVLLLFQLPKSRWVYTQMLYWGASVAENAVWTFFTLGFVSQAVGVQYVGAVWSLWGHSVDITQGYKIYILSSAYFELLLLLLLLLLLYIINYYIIINTTTTNNESK